MMYNRFVFIRGDFKTQLTDKPHDYFQLDSYRLEFNNRINGRGDGVCLFISKTNIIYLIRHDFAKINHSENVKSLFTGIERIETKSAMWVSFTGHQVEMSKSLMISQMYCSLKSYTMENCVIII